MGTGVMADPDVVDSGAIVDSGVIVGSGVVDSCVMVDSGVAVGAGVIIYAGASGVGVADRCFLIIASSCSRFLPVNGPGLCFQQIFIPGERIKFFSSQCSTIKASPDVTSIYL